MFQNWPSLQHTEIASWEGELSHVGGMSCGRSALCKKSCPYNIPKSYVGRMSCRKSAVLLAPRLFTTRLFSKKKSPPRQLGCSFGAPTIHNSAFFKKRISPRQLGCCFGAPIIHNSSPSSSPSSSSVVVVVVVVVVAAVVVVVVEWYTRMRGEQMLELVLFLRLVIPVGPDRSGKRNALAIL